MTIEARRTPDERFADLPGYPFAPNYLQDLAGFEGLRLHYLDEGPKDADGVALCLHGQPTWCYLYRKMIPIFVESGLRVIAPDMFGFGRSDKPIADQTYTFAFHRNTLIRLIESLDLRNITLVCQDWGGILGLTLPMDQPDRFSRLLVMNTALATGAPPGEGFLAWKSFVASNPDFDIPRLMARSEPMLTASECAAYGAPFPDRDHRAGVRRFPELVPITPEMEGADLGRRAAQWWRQDWTGESFMAIGMKDPVLGPDVMHRLRAVIKGCPAPLEIEDGGHFVQEHGDIIARAALDRWTNRS